MTWAKFCDGFLDHPKVLRAGEDASNLFMRGCIWCNKHLTDGAIPREALRALTSRRDALTLAAKLVAVRLWEETSDGWQVHDWSDHNPTRESVEGRREKTREKVASWREKRGNVAGNAVCNHGCNPVTCEECNPVRNQHGNHGGNPAPDPTRPVQTNTSAVDDAKASPPAVPSKSRDAEAPDPSSAAGRAVAALEATTVLRGIVKRPNTMCVSAVAAFPAVDVAREIAAADAWLVANPKNAKKDGDRYLNGWLTRAQERAPRVGDDGGPRGFAPHAATREQIAERLPIHQNKILKGLFS